VVYNAIKIGYRLLDGACDYGNEKEAGEGLRRAIKDGLVKREDICGFSLYLGSEYCGLIKYHRPVQLSLPKYSRSNTLDPNL